jgi:ABC-type oligopeptide transport system substrate-binding subunit
MSQHSKKLVPLFVGALGAASLVLTVACSKAPGTEERKTETTTQTSQGEVKTTTESTRAGNTLEAKTETKADTANGTVKAAAEVVVGTVTVYEPGKKLEVMTADKKTNSFPLDAKDSVVSVDSGVVVGSRVKVTDQTGDDKARRVTVKLEG